MTPTVRATTQVRGFTSYCHRCKAPIERDGSAQSVDFTCSACADGGCDKVGFAIDCKRCMADAPKVRATPQAVSGALIPDWRAVSRAIPPDFRCDGASDPTILYLLSATSFVPWCKRASVAINEAGRIHDFGYGPARLPGSGLDHFSKDSWDAMYRQCLIDKGHPVIANTHWRGVEWFGGRAWRTNWIKMQRWGWYTYASFLADVDKSVEPIGLL